MIQNLPQLETAKSMQRLVPQSTTPNRIVELDFGILNQNEIKQLSTVFAYDYELYEPRDLKPKAGGVLDLRLGAASKGQVCQTCGKPQEECPGHFGSFDLILPVYNIGFYTAIHHTLKCICKTCSNILLTNDEINSKLRSLFTKPPQTVSAKLDRVQAMMKECEKVTICPHCGELTDL